MHESFLESLGAARVFFVQTLGGVGSEFRIADFTVTIHLWVHVSTHILALEDPELPGGQIILLSSYTLMEI